MCGKLMLKILWQLQSLTFACGKSRVANCELSLTAAGATRSDCDSDSHSDFDCDCDRSLTLIRASCASTPPFFLFVQKSRRKKVKSNIYLFFFLRNSAEKQIRKKLNDTWYFVAY